MHLTLFLDRGDKLKDMLELINRREKQILVHSILYYQFNESIWHDRLYDRVALELYKLMNDYPEEFKQSELYDIFKDFDPATGHDFPMTLEPYCTIANSLFWDVRTEPKTVYVEDFYKGRDIDKYLGL